MALLERLQEGGDYGDVTLTGDDPDKDIGIQIEIPDGEIAKFGLLEITNVFVGLVHNSGRLEIDELHIYEFGGDGINLRTGNVHIKRLIIHSNTPTRPYDEYHQDGLQAYAVMENGYTPDPNGVIENVVIDHVDIVMEGPTCQGIACTENCLYKDWFIGSEYLHISVDYYYTMIFISLMNSIIGGPDVELNKPLRIQNAKGSAHQTVEVYLVGVEEGIHAFDDGILEMGGIQHQDTLDDVDDTEEQEELEEYDDLTDEEIAAANEFLGDE